MGLMEFYKECMDAVTKLIDWLYNKGWKGGGRVRVRVVCANGILSSVP